MLTRPRWDLLQLAVVHLSDAHHIANPSTFISVLLLSLRAMLQMELPHVNVLSKVDMLDSMGELGGLDDGSLPSSVQGYD